MPVIFVCPSCRHRVSVPKRFAGTDRLCPACGGAVHIPEIADELFLEFASRLGRPSPELLRTYQTMQRERAERGQAGGLFQLLCDNGVLTLEEEARFRKLAHESIEDDVLAVLATELEPLAPAERAAEPSPSPSTRESVSTPTGTSAQAAGVDPELMRFAARRADCDLVNTLALPEPEDALDLERERLELERQRLELEMQRLELERRARRLAEGTSPPPPPPLLVQRIPSPPPVPTQPPLESGSRRALAPAPDSRVASGKTPSALRLNVPRRRTRSGGPRSDARQMHVLLGAGAFIVTLGIALGLGLPLVRPRSAIPATAQSQSPTPSPRATPARDAHPAPDPGPSPDRAFPAAAAERAVNECIEEARVRAKAGDFDGAERALLAAEEPARRAGMLSELARVRAKLSELRGTSKRELRLAELLDQAEALLVNGDLDGAGAILDRVASVAPGSSQLGALRARLERLRSPDPETRPSPSPSAVPAPSPTPSPGSIADEKLVARVRAWLTERQQVKCSTCLGRGTRVCSRCDGRGKERFPGKDMTDVVCQRCQGTKTEACSECESGISPARIETARRHFGICGAPLADFSAEGLSLNVEDGRATVVAQVRRLGDSTLSGESSEWIRDASGVWRVARLGDEEAAAADAAAAKAGPSAWPYDVAEVQRAFKAEGGALRRLVERWRKAPGGSEFFESFSGVLASAAFRDLDLLDEIHKALAEGDEAHKSAAGKTLRFQMDVEASDDSLKKDWKKLRATYRLEGQDFARSGSDLMALPGWTYQSARALGHNIKLNPPAVIAIAELPADFQTGSFTLNVHTLVRGGTRANVWLGERTDGGWGLWNDENGWFVTMFDRTERRGKVRQGQWNLLSFVVEDVSTDTTRYARRTKIAIDGTTISENGRLNGRLGFQASGGSDVVLVGGIELVKK